MFDSTLLALVSTAVHCCTKHEWMDAKNSSQKISSIIKEIVEIRKAPLTQLCLHLMRP